MVHGLTADYLAFIVATRCLLMSIPLGATCGLSFVPFLMARRVVVSKLLLKL